MIESLAEPPSSSVTVAVIVGTPIDAAEVWVSLLPASPREGVANVQHPLAAAEGMVGEIVRRVFGPCWKFPVAGGGA